MKKLLFPIAIAASLTACSTSSVTEQDRALPEADQEVSSAMMQDDAAMMDTMPRLMIQGDTTQSLVTFIGKKAGVLAHEGKFTNVDFSMTLNTETPSDMTLASIEATIDISSINTDSEGLTTHLLSADFFDAAMYPTATFKSTSIALVTGNTYAITGDLTLHGVTKPLTFNADITDAYLSATDVSINRTDFGVGAPSDSVKAIDDVIPMTIKIVFMN